MEKSSLNDLIYSFEPLQIITPDPNHKVDETQLQKSIQKSKEMMAVVEEYKRKRAVSKNRIKESVLSLDHRKQ